MSASETDHGRNDPGKLLMIHWDRNKDTNSAATGVNGGISDG